MRFNLLKILSIWLIGFFPGAITLNGQEPANHLDELGRKQGFWQKHSAGGLLEYEGYFKNDLPVGEMKRYHSNGRLKARIIYHEPGDSSHVEMFGTNGQPLAHGSYHGRQKNGLWEYFKEGRTTAKETYANGSKSGLSQIYYDSGELFIEQEFRNDTLHGPYRAFFKSGHPFLECMYNSGIRHGWCISYHPNGEMEMEGQFVRGLRDQTWNFYNENGTLLYQLNYDLGILLNPEVLDQLEEEQFRELDEKKDQITDPEQFMNDPMEYMIRSGLIRF